MPPNPVQSMFHQAARQFSLAMLTGVSAGILIANPATAQTRPSTTALSCGEVSSVVRARGALVLGTGGDTFERVVRDASFCSHGDTLRPFFAPSRDQRQCFVGWRCFEEPTPSR